MFYPGININLKRIVYTLILGGLSLNIILQGFEDKVIKVTASSIMQLEQVLPEIESTDRVLTPLVTSIEKIEDSKFNWAIGYFGLPSSLELNNKKEALIALKRTCDVYKSIFLKFASIIKWIGWLSMIPIILSAIWMYLDFTKGKNKLVTLFCFSIAIFINYKMYGLATLFIDQFLHL